MKLHELGPNPGAKKTAKRIGRGNASGWGRTSGKGEKGQKARAGAPIPRHFEGGQMPLYRRVSKFGFTSKMMVRGTNQYAIVNLGDLDHFEEGTEITPNFLVANGFSIKSKQKAGIKLLGAGSVSKKFKISVHAASESARKKIESAGGSLTIIDY